MAKTERCCVCCSPLPKKPLVYAGQLFDKEACIKKFKSKEAHGEEGAACELC